MKKPNSKIIEEIDAAMKAVDYAVSPSRTCPGKFLNLTMSIPGAEPNDWDWMPHSDNTPEKIAYHVQNYVNARVRERHGDCFGNPCASCLSFIEETISSPDFAYARYRNYGVSIYHRDSDSPTGVSSAGGSGNLQLVEALLKKHGRTSCLSPTEDLRTARPRMI